MSFQVVAVALEQALPIKLFRNWGSPIEPRSALRAPVFSQKSCF